MLEAIKIILLGEAKFFTADAFRMVVLVTSFNGLLVYTMVRAIKNKYELEILVTALFFVNWLMLEVTGAISLWR